MLPSNKFTVGNILALLRQRVWFVLVPLAIGSASAGLIGRRLPDRFSAEATVLVLPQRTPDGSAPSPITTGADGGLRAVTRQIFSRAQLEKVIRDCDLYSEQRRTVAMDKIVDEMRDADISARVLDGDTLRIGFEGNEPQTVVKVTERLASLVTSGNVEGHSAAAEGSSESPIGNVEAVRHPLIEQNDKSEADRRRSIGEVAVQPESDRQFVRSALAQLQTLTDSIRVDKSRRLLLEQQLQEAGHDSRVVGLRGELERLDRQIRAGQDQQARLSQAVVTYQHPIDRPPTREFQLTGPIPDYPVRQGQDDNLHADGRSSQTNEFDAPRAEPQPASALFKLLEPARLAETPVGPHRARIVGMGAAGGAALGVLLIALLVYRDRSFQTDVDIVKELGLPVLTVVPVMQSEADRSAQARRGLIAGIGFGGVVAAGLSVAVYTLVR